jgi:peroxiredoxin
MAEPHDPLRLPDDLPVPEDDGAAAHLPGRPLPHVALPATTGGTLDPGALDGRVVIFAYPRTGRPDAPPGPDWDAIPGARGCTPEVCGVRDAITGFQELGATVVGLSAQSPEDQAEAAERLRLPYPLLSDAEGELARALELPTFEWRGRALLKRLTLLVRDGVIDDVIYPVFPPDRAAATALERLAGGRAAA